ncbi:MAG: 3-isopropylmalate dehydratase small subunit [Rhodothalassiaceae bacterium]
MEPFTTLVSVPTPLLRDNVDTDLIIPAAWLKTVSRKGLGAGAFESLRKRPDGSPDPDCVFNRPQYRGSQILVSGRNFGCGSSREHAAWALADLGYRCVIAESFADIFASNAFKNGILTITLAADDLARVAADAEAVRPVRIDLAAQTVTTADGTAIAFALDAFRRHCLLSGLDEVSLTLEKHAAAIAAYEEAARQRMPWAIGG